MYVGFITIQFHRMNIKCFCHLRSDSDISWALQPSLLIYLCDWFYTSCGIASFLRLSVVMTITHLKIVLPKSTKNRKYTYTHTNILHKLLRNSREYGFVSRQPVYWREKGKGSNNYFHEQNDLNKSSF